MESECLPQVEFPCSQTEYFESDSETAERLLPPPFIVNLPVGHAVLLFGRTYNGFVAITGDEQKCLSETEIGQGFGEAVVRFFNQEGQQLKVHPVKHGHKYDCIGGMAEFDDDDIVAWKSGSISQFDACLNNDLFKFVYIAL